jgi:carbonic anhydrase
MSNQNIDISLKNVVGKCDLKCSYAFKYTESNTTAKNNGVVINLTYDNRSIPPVTYNGEKYQVSNISIVSPSIHNFNGSLMPGEILIEHVPIKGGNKLQVCIPFSSSSESSTASNILTEIINKVAANAPRQGDSTNLNISNFNLQNIIPKKPFFLYSNNTDDYLVFGSIDAIPLSSSTITTLQKIIKQFSLPTPGNNLFYNSKGPISGLQIGKDGIYISCQPTGSSTEETAITYDINSSSVDFSNVINSPIFQTFILIIIGCILFIIVFYGLSSFYNYISKDNIKLPNLPGIPK